MARPGGAGADIWEMPIPPAAKAIAPFLLMVPLAPALAAQDGDAVQRVERNLRELDSAFRLELPADATIAERLLLDFGGAAQFGLYSIDDEESESHVLRQYDGRVWLRAELDGSHRFFGRLKFRYDDWNHGDDFDGEGDDFRAPVGERWWYQFDLRGGQMAASGERPTGNVDLKLGKQYLEWGNGLVFSDVLIAAIGELEWDGLVLDLLAGDTAPNDFVDYDPSRPSFESDTQRRFLGALLEHRSPGFTPFVHVLRQIDHNDRDAALFTDGVFLFPTFFNYDSTYYGAGARGSLGASTSWHAEFDYEVGDGLSSPIDANGFPAPQTEEHVRAWAFAGGLAYVLHDRRSSRLESDLIVASGDEDRLDSAETFGGNRSGSADRAWNAFGFVNTGIALAPDPSNLVTLRLGGVTSPFFGESAALDRLRVLLDGFVYFKLDEDAPINVPTTSDRFVGGEVDLGVDWNVWSDVTVSLRYGLFFPGPALPSGMNDLRQTVYGSLTYAF